MPHLCELCGERPATVFITKIVDNDSSKHSFCTRCATTQAQGQSWLSDLAEQIGDSRLVEDVQDAIEQFSFETFVSQMMHPSDDEEDALNDDFFDDEDSEDVEAFSAANDSEWYDESSDDDVTWLGPNSLDDPFADAGFDSPFAEVPEAKQRCSGCGTTWDRINSDGRTGCAACYNTFREQFGAVMGRVQRGAQHVGKLPRAAEKRKRRLEHLRQRRDNQLQLLQNRLKEAVVAERYEEAAQLRDRIKIVASTIVSE